VKKAQPFYRFGQNWFLKALTVGWLSVIGCGQPGSDDPRGAAAPPVQRSQGNGSSSAQRGTLRERQATFLNQIREADPSHQTIQKALINENNELGLVLSRQVEMDSVPTLLRSILTRMAEDFPGQDLTVIAYAPSNPPIKIGTAQLKAATRKMTYTPANHT
jgi:hypothetical protein